MIELEYEYIINIFLINIFTFTEMKNERKYSKYTINDILHLTRGSWIQLILNYSSLIARNFQYILHSHLRGKKMLGNISPSCGVFKRYLPSTLIQYLISISITLLILISTPRSLISTRDKKSDSNV